jgi:hypothetical protein
MSESKQDVIPQENNGLEISNNKYPNNIMCRCKIKFYFQNGEKDEHEINVSMDKIALIQTNMSSSIENKEGHSLIYLEGSKNSTADFCIIPIKNINYLKFEVQESTPI